MQIFAVTIEKTSRRKLQIAALDADHARKIAGLTLPDGQRIIAATPINTEVLMGIPAADLGADILDFILQKPWLSRDGKQHQCIADWVAMANLDDAARIIANKSLGMAGLRVSNLRELPTAPLASYLLIASPFSHPQIAEWARTCEGGNSAFLPALAALKGAYRPKVGFTIASIPSRVVAIPMDSLIY